MSFQQCCEILLEEILHPTRSSIQEKLLLKLCEAMLKCRRVHLRTLLFPQESAELDKELSEALSQIRRFKGYPEEIKDSCSHKEDNRRLKVRGRKPPSCVFRIGPVMANVVSYLPGEHVIHSFSRVCRLFYSFLSQSGEGAQLRFCGWPKHMNSLDRASIWRNGRILGLLMRKHRGRVFRLPEYPDSRTCVLCCAIFPNLCDVNTRHTIPEYEEMASLHWLLLLAEYCDVKAVDIMVKRKLNKRILECISGLNKLESVRLNWQSTRRDSVELLQSWITSRNRLKVLSLRNATVGGLRNILPDIIQRKNTNLCTLNLSNCELKSRDAEVIGASMMGDNSWKSLILSHNQIDDVGLLRLCGALRENSSLKGLDLSNNSITKNGAKGIALCLMENSTLEQLSLSHNNLKDGICGIFSNNNTLKCLELDHTRMTANGCVEILNSLSKCGRTSSFDHLRLMCEEEEVVLGSRMCEGIPPMCCFFLKRSTIGKVGMRSILRSKTFCDTITVLVLERTIIECEFGGFRGSTFPNLAFLDLSSSSFSSIRVQSAFEKNMGKFLESSCSINHLKLSGTTLSLVGALGLFSALGKNSSLLRLELQKCWFAMPQDGAIDFSTDPSIEKAFEGLGNNKTLHELDISFNYISDDIAVALAKGISENRSMMELDIRSNLVTQRGAESLIRSFLPHDRYVMLHLVPNRIGDDGRKKLKAFLAESKAELCVPNLVFNASEDDENSDPLWDGSDE